jgi:hypothetical protein
MWESAISGAKWIVDALLKKHSDDKTIKRQKWLQVADYLETIAKSIENAVSDFDKGHLPYNYLSQLNEMSADFGDVLAQIYRKDDQASQNRIRRYTDALDISNNIILLEDRARLGAGPPLHSNGLSESEQREFADLQIIAGQFRALAATLRATA